MIDAVDDGGHDIDDADATNLPKSNYPPNTTLTDLPSVPVMTSHALIAANTLAVQEPEDATEACSSRYSMV